MPAFRTADRGIDTKINGRASDSYTGNYLNTPIGEVITIEALHALPQYGLTFSGDAQIVLKESSTYDLATGGRGEPLSGYEVVNTFVEYKPRRMENLILRGEINNLFDATYSSRATYGQEFSTVVPLKEPGRFFKASATLNF